MDKALFRNLAAEMCVTKQRVTNIHAASSFEEAKKRLEALKVDAKAAYKRLAFKYHPDRNPGDAEAEAKFKALGAVLKEVEGLEVQPPRPQPTPVQPPPTTYYSRRPGGPSIFTTATNTANTGVGYDARRVVFIRG
jgi:hypothetical protein